MMKKKGKCDLFLMNRQILVNMSFMSLGWDLNQNVNINLLSCPSLKCAPDA